MMPTTRFRVSALYLAGILGVVVFVIGLPMSFEFRQLVSIGGVTFAELLLLTILVCLTVHRPRAWFPRQYQNICLLLYLFLLWAAARGLLAVLEGAELGMTLRNLRHYLPLLTMPPLLYLLNSWKPNATTLITAITKCFGLSYFVYMLFLVAVTLSPELSDLLMMRAFFYRIGSNTLVISMTLLLLGCLLWSERLLKARTVVLILLSVGVTVLLAQSRVSSAMLVFLLFLAVCLYTLRTSRMRFAGIGIMLILSVATAVSAVFLSLNAAVPDFDKFSELLVQRVQQHQAGRSPWDSLMTYSFGTEELRRPVVERAVTRPVLGFGEGEGVGETMSQEDGAYIDSTVLTMWFKNGFVGTTLFYSFWLTVLARVLMGYLRHRVRFFAGVASIAAASLITWLLWSSANAFLMYGWVLYPIVALTCVWLFILQKDTSPRECPSNLVARTAVDQQHQRPSLLAANGASE